MKGTTVATSRRLPRSVSATAPLRLRAWVDTAPHTGLPLTGHALPSASLYSATAASYSADISSQRSSCWVSWAASWARSLASWVAVVGSFS